MASAKDRALRFLKKSWIHIKHPVFLKNMGYLTLFALAFLLLSNRWLSCYTNHGQKLVVPDLVNLKFDRANSIANDKSFELIVSDSIFVLDQDPQLILSQNPLPKETVKEGRKIYVTISKVVPDLVNMPNLTGGNDDYNQYSRKLERLGVTAKIVDRKYSIKLERNTILDIKFQGESIFEKVKAGYKVPMGGIVEFVVSDRRGGTVELPNLICKTYEEASFLISSNKLSIGKVTLDDSVTDQSVAYVKRQEPAYSPSVSLEIGRNINLVLTQFQPKNCGGDDYQKRSEPKKDVQ